MYFSPVEKFESRVEMDSTCKRSPSPFVDSSSSSSSSSSHPSTVTIVVEPMQKKVNYRSIYRTAPWYIIAHVIVYIVIYNVYYPNDSRLDFLRLDTDHVRQAWRFFSHVFLHANASHLVANAILIAALTLMLGTAWHPQQWRIMALYSLAILQGASGVGWEKRINRPDDRLIGVGASGASYGLLGMNASDLVLNWGTMPLRWFRLFILICAIVGEILGWYFVYEDSVTVSGHVGGFIGGVLGGPALLLDANIAQDLASKTYFTVFRYYTQKQSQKRFRSREVVTESQLPDIYSRQEQLRHAKLHIQTQTQTHMDSPDTGADPDPEKEVVAENRKEEGENASKCTTNGRSLKNRILFVTSCILYPLYTIAGIVNYFTLEV